MTPIPYLFFNGQARAALGAYGEIFGAEPEIMEASAMPPEFAVPEGRENWVMHGSLKVGEGQIMASDNIMGTSDDMAGCSVLVSLPSAAEGKAIFDALAEGGEITMPWEPTFWAAGFGTLTDRFGVRWQVGTDEPPAE